MQPKDTEIVRLIGEPKTCLVRESNDKDGHFDILAPGIGLFDMPPAAGTYLMPGSFVGYLTEEIVVGNQSHNCVIFYTKP